MDNSKLVIPTGVFMVISLSMIYLFNMKPIISAIIGLVGFLITLILMGELKYHV